MFAENMSQGLSKDIANQECGRITSKTVLLYTPVRGLAHNPLWCFHKRKIFPFVSVLHITRILGGYSNQNIFKGMYIT